MDLSFLVKIFISLMTLFVAVNLVMTVYNSIHRYSRQGFDTHTSQE